jgi:single-strand DNA-binding protein
LSGEKTGKIYNSKKTSSTMRNNNVELIGYVGDSPKIINCKDGSKRAVIRVATHREIKYGVDKSVYSTTWHTVIAWDKKADEAANSFVKSSHIQVWGSIEYRKYTDKEGRLCNVTEIRAYDLANLDR